MALLAFIAVLALIILASRFNRSLGHAMWLGCFIFAWAGSMSPSDLIAAVVALVTEPKSLALIAVVALLLALGRGLEASGLMDQAVHRMQKKIRSPKTALFVFPAVIGLLPVPGGSIFSAPIVESLSKGLGVGQARKSVINYWFRHVWEYSWPLYPAMITICVLSEISMAQLVVYAGLLTPISAVIGWFLLLPRLKGWPEEAGLAKDDRPDSLAGLIPLAVVLVGALAGGPLAARLQRIDPALAVLPSQTSFILALIVGVWLTMRLSPVKLSFSQIALTKQAGKIIYFLAAVLAFKNVALASGLIEELGRTMSAHHLPLTAIVCLLPFAIGLTTGYALAYVAAGFPVFIGLLPAEGFIPYLVLGHYCGFMGVLLSPAHPCLILSNQYFTAPTGEFYRLLWPACLLTLACGAAVVAVWFNFL